jgi:hypothetical protein
MKSHCCLCVYVFHHNFWSLWGNPLACLRIPLSLYPPLIFATYDISPCCLSACVSHLFFVRRLMISPCCLCVVYSPSLFLFLSGPCRVKETYQITLFSVCPPLIFAFSMRLVAYKFFQELLIVSRPALGSTQPPIQWVPGALSSGVKLPGREAVHPTPPSAEVKKMWIYTSRPPYAFMA